MTIAAAAVINGNTAKYSGDAVYSSTSSWSIINSGVVAGKGDGFGVDLAAGGGVTNNRLIEGGLRGVSITGSSGAPCVTNSGTIQGLATGGVGVLLFPGGTVRNGRQAGKFLQPLPGTITGARNGVEILGAVGSVSNIGTIAGGTGYGVWLAAAGRVSNSCGTIAISGAVGW